MNQSATHETKSFFSADKRLLFILLCLLTLLLLYVKITFIEHQTAAFEFLQDRPEGFILKVLSGLKFLSVPFVYLWKVTVIAFVIWTGCFMFGYRVTYAQSWAVVLAAEYIFLIPEALKILWFLFIQKDPSYSDIGSFYPFSLMHFADYETLEKRWAYPLRALNLFEVAYWFLLVEGINHWARKDKKYVWIIVLSSYVLIFFLWLVFYVAVYK
jgi:hypothetical protein